MRALFYHASRLIAKLLVAPFVKIRILRPELAARPGPWILAANHISHFDPPFIAVATARKIDWMGMRDLFAHPLPAAWLYSIDTFPVDRANLDRQAVRTALARLRAGHVLGMFPEGGIRDGPASVLERAPIRPGVSALAQITGAPIIPCVIIGSDRCYILPSLWRPWRRITVWIGFGQPIFPPTSQDRSSSRTALDASLADAFCQLAAEMRDHFNLSPADMPQSATRRRLESRAGRSHTSP